MEGQEEKEEEEEEEKKSNFQKHRVKLVLKNTYDRYIYVQRVPANSPRVFMSSATSGFEVVVVPASVGPPNPI